MLGTILSGARTARITKALVYDEQAAASASAGQSTNEDVGDFGLVITPRPGHTLTTLEAADRRDHRAPEEGRPDGRRDAEGHCRRRAGVRQQPASRISARRSSSPTAPAITATPATFRTDYQKTLAVTADDVKRVANKYLTRGRVVLSVVPTGKLDQAAKPEQSKRVTDYDTKKPEGGK